MTYRQIEACREARLWVTQVVAPTLVLGLTVVMTNPELKEKVTTKFNNVKDTIKGKLQK